MNNFYDALNFFTTVHVFRKTRVMEYNNRTGNITYGFFCVLKKLYNYPILDKMRKEDQGGDFFEENQPVCCFICCYWHCSNGDRFRLPVIFRARNAVRICVFSTWSVFKFLGVHQKRTGNDEAVSCSRACSCCICHYVV